MVMHQPGHRLAGQIGQGAVRGNHIAPLCIDKAEIHMQPRSAAFGDRLWHKGQDIAFLERQLAGHEPEQERIITGLQRIVKTQRHFELAIIIFAIHRFQRQADRRGARPDGIDKGPRRVIGAKHPVCIPLKDKGLQLQTDHRCQPHILPSGNRMFQRMTRA